MQLTIHGSPQVFMPIKQFRAQYNVPEDFGVHYFEPKDYTGLATLDHAGEALNKLHADLIAALPAHITLPTLMPILDQLRANFELWLRAMNAQVGLREPEIGFAVAGLGDMLQTWLYALIRTQATKQPPPDFLIIYANWLQESIRLSATRHEYEHHHAIWYIQIVNHVYGRVGLEVNMGDEIIYVQDGRDACPAEGFMFNLLRDITDTIIKRSGM
jgi:hypothetical protein